jgi:hypothetical protein
MKGSYIEVLATHGGPDHALATREGAAKRWIGVHAGRLLSLEIAIVWDADVVGYNGRQHRWRRFREPSAGPAGSKNPLHACDLLHAENREGPRSPACGDGRAGRAGKAKAVIP